MLDSNVKILRGANDSMHHLELSVATGTVVGFGDLIEATSGAAVCVNAAGDNDTFAGCSLNSSQTGETQNIIILTRGWVKIAVASATYDIGAALKYSSGANGTDWELEAASSGADGIMWSMQYKSSAVTSLECKYDSELVVTETAGGGLFETLAA